MTARISSWEGIKQLFSEAKYSVVTVVGMPFRIWAMMRELLKEGCFIIESNFEYKGNPFYIRTFIQPDADIITIIGIPQLNSFPLRELYVDPENEILLMSEYAAHNERIVTAFEELDGRREFWGKTIDFTTLIVNIYPLYQAFMEQTTDGMLLAGVVAAGSIVFRQFAKKKAIGLLVKGLFKIVGKYFKFM